MHIVWERGGAMRNCRERQSSPLPADTEGWKEEQRGDHREEHNEV